MEIITERTVSVTFIIRVFHKTSIKIIVAKVIPTAIAEIPKYILSN